MRSKSLILIAFLLMLFIAPMIFTLSYGGVAIPTEQNTNKDFLLASESWLTGWNYRKAIAINGSAGAGTDYQVLVEEIYNSNMQADFDAIRFTDNDGVTLLDYWLEYYDPDAPIIELADYGELSDESSSPDYILTNIKDGNAFNETSATDLEIWFEVDTTVAGFEGFSYAHYLYVDSGTDCDLTAYNFDTDLFDKIDEPLPSTYDWMNGTIYDSDYWNTTHIAFSLFELSGTADLYWDYGEITHSKIASFWVNVTDNLDTDQTIYMYYGNEGASSLSNGTATFLFYEDWSSQSLDAWTVAPEQTDGQITYSSTGATQGGYVAKVEGDAEDSYLIYTDYAHTASFATMFRANIEEASTGNLGRMGTGWAGAYGWAFVETSAMTDERLSVYDDDENPDHQTMTSAYFDTWVTFQITRDGTETNLYADFVLIETASFAPDIISNPVCSIQVTDSEEDIYSDWVAVRKFVSSEPCVTSFGEEEDYLPPPEWEGAGTVIILFEVPVFTGSFDALLIFLGLIMIPASTLYLVKGGKDEMSTDKLFYFLIAFVIGWGLFLGGIYG